MRGSFASLLLVLTASWCPAIGSFTAFPIATGSDQQYCPDVGYSTALGSYVVVWHGGVWPGPGPDIFGFDVSASSAFPICTHSGGQWRAHISGNTVVWRDDRNGNDDIYGYDLSGGGEFEVSVDSRSEDCPDICGNTVVWANNVSGYLYARQLPGDEFTVRDGVGYLFLRPAISGNVAAWVEDSGLGEWVVCAADIADPGNIDRFEVGTNAVPTGQPAICGDIVVWEKNDGSLWVADIADPSDISEFEIVSDGAWPAISGNMVVWESDGSIWGADISDPGNISPFEIASVGRFPAINGNVVAWEVSENNGDIYGAIIPEPFTLSLLTIGGLTLVRRRRRSRSS